jgi:predicted O-methyltransferase YrrM
VSSYSKHEVCALGILTVPGTSYPRLLLRALRHPNRAILRLILRSRLMRSDERSDRVRLLAFLTEHFDVDAQALEKEYAESEFRDWYRRQIAELASLRGPRRLGTTGYFGCEALYLLVRAARPSHVIETGVLYGASSAHILAALARNGEGELHSIELGKDPREPPHEFLVPTELQGRWDLIIGDARRELPSLVQRLPNISLFHHDSLHTYDHMMWEFETVYPYLDPDGVLSSDDVVSVESLKHVFRKNAFTTFCQNRVQQWATFQNLGIALKGAVERVTFSAISAAMALPGFTAVL